MKLDDLLRDTMHDVADDGDVPDIDLVALEKDLEKHDRNKLIERVVITTTAFIVAVLIALQLAPGGSHKRGPQVAHDPGRSPVSAAPRVVPPKTNTRNNGSTGGGVGSAPIGAGGNVRGTGGVTGNASGPTRSGPGAGTQPGAGNGSPEPGGSGSNNPPSDVALSDPNFWAIASEASDNSGNPMLLVFGKAPTGSHVTVSASGYPTRDYVTNNQGDFQWRYELGHTVPAMPINFTVACDGCGTLHVGIDHFDATPQHPAPTQGFSSYFVDHQNDWNPAGFVFGGFSPARGSSVVLQSQYGNYSFDVKHDVWGGRVNFPGAPLNTSFTVSVVVDGVTQTTVDLTRTR